MTNESDRPSSHSPSPTDDIPSTVPHVYQSDAALPSLSGPSDAPVRDTHQSGSTLRAIADYEVLSVLGHGGMGIVYKAYDRRLERTVAVKRIVAGGQSQPDQLARFRVEAQAAARLQHPNIIQIHEIGDHDGSPYLALEYVEGGSLAQKLAGTPQPPREAARLVEVLARAMHAAHERGVVHRDLKPANVLLTADGTPKISDFGLAKLLDADSGQTQTEQVMGTPSYMAPEQAAGRSRDVGPTVDVYALGAILYELLTGRPPFRGASKLDTLEQVRTLDPVPPSRLQPKMPKDLETVCLKCLRKAPAQRYGSAAELAEDLRRFQAGEPILARPVSPWERGRIWIRRHPVASSLSAVSAVFVLGLLSISLGYNGALVRQRDRAESNLDVAAQALSRLARQAEGSAPAEIVAGLKEAQQSIEQAARAYPKEPRYQYRQVALLTNLGNVYIRQGQFPAAEAALRQALEVQRPWSQIDPDNSERLRSLAAIHTSLGAAALSQGQSARAESAHQEALAVRQRLAVNPGEPRHQRELAETCFNLGMLYSQRNMQDGAEESFHAAKEALEKSLAILEKLARQPPPEPADSSSLARSCTMLADLYLARWQGQDRPDLAKGAGANLERARDLYRRLVAEHPRDFDHRAGLGRVCFHYVWYYRFANKDAELQAACTEAIQYLEPLFLAQNRYADVRDQLNQVYWLRADARGKDKQSLFALLLDRDRSMFYELRQPHRAQKKLARTESIARLGEHAFAAQEAESLAALPGFDEVDFATFGRVFALCCAAAAKDENVPAAERQRLADRYALQATTWLKKACHKSYFRDPNNVDELRKDPNADWAGLRNRSDFEQLLRDLGESKSREEK